MKIALINPPDLKIKNAVKDLLYGCWCQGKRIGGSEFPPLNLLFIASLLEKDYFVKVIIPEAIRLEYNDLIRYISKFDYVIIPTTSFCYEQDINFLGKIKNLNKDIISIIFGQYPTFFPKLSLYSQNVDFGIIGEPEFVIYRLMSVLSRNNLDEIKKIKGICYRENNKIMITGKSPFIENLDDLPIPNRKYIRGIYFFNPLTKNKEWTTALTSRGCPARCNFCLAPEFYGYIYRYQSPLRMIQEIKYLISEGYKEIFYRDETFTGEIKRTEKFCRNLIQNKIKIDWICNVRIGTVNRKILHLMKKAGCHYIKIGVESGSQLILNNLNKDITLEGIKRTFKISQEVGINTHAHVILGGPGETIQTINKTIRFIKNLNPTTVTFNLFTPFPGTKIFNEIKHEFQGPLDEFNLNFRQCLINPTKLNKFFTNLDERFLSNLIPLAYRKFYIRLKYILKQLKEMRSFYAINRIIKSSFNILSFIFESAKLNFDYC
ncbi:MAG: B12-binding domain-containing radical SAM protein [Candidatus Helarchaeota archaeon]